MNDANPLNVDPGDAQVTDPGAHTEPKAAEPDVEPAEGARLPHPAPALTEPELTFGQAVYESLAAIDASGSDGWGHPAWDGLDPGTQAAYVAAALAAIAAYDAHLVGEADRKAEAVIHAPTFADQLAAAQAAGAVRPVEVNPGPIDVPAGEPGGPDPAENPADAFRKALEVEQRHARSDEGPLL